MSFQLLLEDWQGSSIPDRGGKIIPPARMVERECSDITWHNMNACSRYKNCVQHHKTRTRDRTLTQWYRTWSASVQIPARNRNSRHECQDLNNTLQHETRHADERARGSSTLEAAYSRENRTWRELEVCTGSKLKPEPDPTRPDPSGTVKFRARFCRLIADKYNVVTCESVACRSYFTNKSFRAVCARSLICVCVRLWKQRSLCI